jgi:ferritin
MKGFSHWMRTQTGEELVHTMKMLDYVASSGGRARMLSVEAPQFTWASPLKAFQHVWDHERAVTRLIHALVKVAEEEKDRETKEFLQWYVKEQVEEEESSDSVLNMVIAAGEDRAALEAADRELAERRFRFPRGFEIFPRGSCQSQ